MLTRILTVLLSAPLWLPVPVSLAQGHSYDLGSLHIEDPWARPAAAAGNGAVYFSVTNSGGRPDRLLSARSEITTRVELHESYQDQGMMRMRPVEGIAVPAENSVELAPGGLHVMLLGLRKALAAGSRFPVKLRFERAGEIEILVRVDAEGGAEKGDAMPRHDDHAMEHN